MSNFIDTADARTRTYLDGQIGKFEPIAATDIDSTKIEGFESKQVGKVRDVYRIKGQVVIVATDRLSAFDRQLSAVPFKGQVLNLTSLFWFKTTAHIVPNHVIASPHPNITIGKSCTVFPVEFVMRGYLTGSTSTSIWTNYSKGNRFYCGHVLPDGLRKNQKLPSNLLTPTTKDDVHDELISAEQIVSSGRMSQDDWNTCERYATLLFNYSQELAHSKGLILVDTKYEFGKDESGAVILVDEIQTPDSSRYWIAASYEERMAAGEEPENIDMSSFEGGMRVSVIHIRMQSCPRLQ